MFDKYCFVITPIGVSNSEIWNKTNGLIHSVIMPVFKEFGFTVEASHNINSSGSITDQIIERLLESKIVVANLTGLNPNVMYELAVRHAKKLPVITLAESGTILPFDIMTERTIFYDDTMKGAEELKPKLKAAYENIDPNQDNPIYRGVRALIMKEVEKSPYESYLMDKMDQISNQLISLNNISKREENFKNSNGWQYDIILTGRRLEQDDKASILELANTYKIGSKYGNTYPNASLVFTTPNIEDAGILKNEIAGLRLAGLEIQVRRIG
ncbi:hypothetical protein J2X69_002691 [Algoriphagus sp. 4150]|uniref:hypothetical protein n=1 Tax=Algoriphagus sp. 4150 TaxID=2817756 RepID=UPI002862E494|nr:hypothetical protein [Algoriphagus sp. 4150]MDR7130341.1 hypothetical protein [Algoriphagus sp. 4150]